MENEAVKAAEDSGVNSDALFVWSLLNNLYSNDTVTLERLLQDNYGQALDSYIKSMLGLTPESLKFSFMYLEALAQAVTQELDEDFKRHVVTVKDVTPLVRQVISPRKISLMIKAFETDNTPELSYLELITGTWLILITGERDIPDFDVFEFLMFNPISNDITVDSL